MELISLDQNPGLLAFSATPRKVFTFRTGQPASKDTIGFEKILFTSTTCYGTCPAMSLQIDNKKQMAFVGGDFAVKQGRYSMILPNHLYNRLLDILAVSELDRLENVGRFNIDAPTYTIEVHYNNKIKYIRSSFMPFVIDELLHYLLDLPSKVLLYDN